ncbi:MAG: hypothetical protein SWO11_17090 [Thermodesulfobacteriota bacterium]|nr:hypothetical protein [Thermodesulfobacteriota bacterium]
MVDKEKIKAVYAYIKNEFDGCIIEDTYDMLRTVQTFRVAYEESVFKITILKDFFDDKNPSDIPALLQSFLLAEHLRDMGSTPLIVTKEGLTLE